MKHIKMKPLLLAMAIATPAMAQDEAPVVEEVVVTGFRQSIESALNTKRDSTGVVDAIYAEDVADFPDNNLAESLQRIPGVAISRAGGEGRTISVRGLGPQYTRVRINGMEAMSSTGSTDAAGGNNRGRGFDFNTFSADLFSALIVRKTNSAEVDEGSLGATVDMKTARPMDLDEFTFSVSGQIGYNELSEEMDPKTALLVSKQFSDTFGALASISYSERNLLDEGNSTVRWSDSEDFGSYTGTCDGAVCDAAGAQAQLDLANAAFHPRIPRYDSYEHSVERTGAAVTLQFTPTDVTDISLDFLYSKHDASRQEVFMQGVMNSGGAVGGYELESFVIEGDTLVYANIPNANLNSENRYDELSTEFTQVTLSFSHEFSDTFRMNGLVGTAKSEFANPIQNTVIMTTVGAGLEWDYRGDNGDTVLNFGDAAYEASNWAMSSIRQRPQGTNNEFTNVALNLEFDLSDSLTLKTGVNSKAYDFDTYAVRLGSEGANGVDIQTDGYIISYDSGLGEGRPWLIPNRTLIAANEGVIEGNDTFQYTNLRLNDNYAISEDTTSLYAQLDFDTTIGDDIPVTGDIGFRYFTTDQSSTGWFDTDNDAATPDVQVWVDHDYNDILPALNLKIEPLENVIIRMGLSEGISRAGIGSLKADQSISVSGSSRSISGGNPLLEPTKATSYDLGAELYFSSDSALSLTVFRKDIDSHVQTLKDQKTPSSLGIPTSIVESECAASPSGYGTDCNENILWDRSVPLNGPGGSLQGFEVSYQTSFAAFGEMWENFGFIGNYTYVKSQLAYLDSDGNVDVIADLLNMSETTQSATIYYENDVFGARLAMVERGDYLTDARGRNGNVQAGTYGTTNLDFSASYTLSDNLKFTFEAQNLTNEADDQWVDRNDYRLSYYHETGSQFYLGAQYKF